MYILNSLFNVKSLVGYSRIIIFSISLKMSHEYKNSTSYVRDNLLIFMYFTN